MELYDFEEFKKAMKSDEPLVLGKGVDLSSTDLGVTNVNKTEIDVPWFEEKPTFRGRLKNWFGKLVHA